MIYLILSEELSSSSTINSMKITVKMTLADVTSVMCAVGNVSRLVIVLDFFSW